MSLKRKFDASGEKLSEIFENKISLLPNENEIDDNDDSSDEEFSDSYYECNDEELPFESENGKDGDAGGGDSDWEDMDSETDNIIEKAGGDSDYGGSSQENSIIEAGHNKSEGPSKPQKKKILRKKKAHSKKELQNSNVSMVNSKKINASTLDKTKKPPKDEYANDTSDEEDLRSTVGNIPINWYDEYEHLGYGLDSLPILKPKQGDTLDKFLDRLENPDHGRTVYDKQTGQNVVLSAEDLDLVNRLMSGTVPNPKHNFYSPFHDLYSHEVMKFPLSGRQEHKRGFLPSKTERQKVARLACLIRRGLYKRRMDYIEKPKQKYYDLWKPRSKDDPRLMRIADPIAAPKMILPGHIESYNPPPEYLMTRHDINGLKGEDIGDRPLFKGFWRKFKSVRKIPWYQHTIKNCFERLMDLYLAPRKKYRKIVAQSKDFLPQLPDKKDLRPYPTLEGLVFEGHRSIIRTISVHPSGKYLASGSDDHTVRVWEMTTGRCLRTFEVEDAVKKVSWNPNPKLFLLGIAMGKNIVFLNPETYLTDKLVVQQTNAIFKEEVEQGDYIVPERIKAAVTWRKPTEEEWSKGYRIVLEHFREVKEIVWHRQGDYFASVIPEGDHRSVLMHQLSRWRSQIPFKKNKGRVQTVAFHPKEAQLFVVTQTNVRIYDLKRQRIIKKVQANSRWVSCIAVHPGGEHYVIGTYDRRVNWFELECTKRPHLMRYHGMAVRSINFHRKYPLYATCSDDCKVIVTHGMVYDDMLKDPLIVPLKQLKGHRLFDDLYVLDVAWHPFEPYLLTAGADATIRLWH